MAVKLSLNHTFFLPVSSPLPSSTYTTRLKKQIPISCLQNWFNHSYQINKPKNPISVVRCASSVSIEKVEYLPPMEVSEVDSNCKKWEWKGHRVNYLVYPQQSSELAAAKPPLLLVHGFGASVAHWRR